MNKLDTHSRYLAMTGVIANLENKLIKAKAKNPKIDFKEQETIIAVLKDYHNSYMDIQQENITMERKYLEMADKHSKMLEDNKRISKELKTLKGASVF